MNGNDREAFFSKEEIASFYRQTIARHQIFEIERPDRAGWELIEELRGEPKDDIPSPVLFNIYGRGENNRMVITSAYLHKRHLGYVGAANNEEGDLLGPVGKEQTEQEKKVRLWMALIGRVFAAEVDKESYELQKAEVDMIGRMAWSVIQNDLRPILSLNEKNQKLRVKEAGTAYQSGLINFLVATGQRAKRGGKPIEELSDPLPKELLAVYRAWQFVAKHFELPTQAWVRKQLESEGVAYKQGRGREGTKWTSLFFELDWKL